MTDRRREKIRSQLKRLAIVLLLPMGFSTLAVAQTQAFKPVTTGMLENPAAADWLMLSRTYDEQRFSPLDQVNKDNVDRLRMAWTRGLPAGAESTIPIVYDGVMYVVSPVNSVLALDATTGDLIWEYARAADPGIALPQIAGTSSKSLAIYHDLIYYTSPDGYLVAIDARDGTVRWEVESYVPYSGAKNTSAPIVVEGKVITARACKDQANCFISAHDALTGSEVWKFFTAAAEGEPGGDSWGDVPTAKRVASLWGLPGSYDPKKQLIYWGTANPQPYTRLSRHGSADGTSRMAPADLYSNSTLALHAETGELAWYYQHLPGDDWDADHTHERVLVRTRVSPDPDAVKWINPGLRPGEERDVVVHIGEGGGMWVLDRNDGQFLWAMPFPVDVPEFNIANIDVETGRTEINWDNVFKKDGDTVLTCYHNTRSYWPMAYHPGTNSIYVAFHDYCLGMTADLSSPSGWTNRSGRLRPGVEPDKAYALAKVDLTTGRLTRLFEGGVPGNGAVLATAGDLIFWGDANRRFRAFDAEAGDVLWETILGGVIQMSTITYAVDGKQYVAVMSGEGNSATRNPVKLAGLTVPRGHNAIYVFALP
ncbi:MAG: PQQ-binding-like beta-propeller repeat protein [Gammaproteobacteria bacterium]|nr:PQQ-binding-like beta-propeller repeat protein [Gammaproteobacteria bacterium]